MLELQTNTTIDEICGAITSWLERKLDIKELDWLTKQTSRFGNDFEEWEFFSAFSGVSRRTGKESLELSNNDLLNAEKIRSGWKPEYWNTDEAARTLIILNIAKLSAEKYWDLLEKTFDSCDMGEAVALYKSIAILPYPHRLRERAAEGVRSNITLVFNAVAHHNPYPADFLDDSAWNQMVLKALFINSELYLIHNFDKRVNKKLADMLVDFTHERWSAGREISPELWRAVGPFAEGEVLNDLKKVLQHPDPVHRSAAILALTSSKSQDAAKIIVEHCTVVQEGNLLNSWEEIGRAVFSAK